MKKLLQTDMEHTVARYKILQTASIYPRGHRHCRAHRAAGAHRRGAGCGRAAQHRGGHGVTGHLSDG
ncbi:MAG: hypothetical protein ACLUNO_03660 [Oscillospiraceae bacterium]